MHQTLLFCLLLLLAPSLRGQAHKAAEHLAKARQQLAATKAGKKEAAAGELRQAWWALHRMEKSKSKEKKVLEREIMGLLRKADPRGKRLLLVQAQTAESLNRLAKEYLEAGLVETAKGLAAQIHAISPYALDAKLHTVLGLPEPVAWEGSNDLLLRWFKGGDTPFDDGEWKFEKSGISAPLLSSVQNSNAILISKKTLRGSFKLSIQLDISRAKRVGICLNVREAKPRPETFYLVEIAPKTCELIVSKLIDGKLKWLGTERMSEEQRSGWCPLEVEVDGRRFTARFADRQRLLALLLPEAVDGKLALYSTSNREKPGPARYRFLEISQETARK